MILLNRQDFVDADGVVNEYAFRTALRSNADVFYLARWRVVGHDVAAQLTCDERGHEARAGLCERCGRGVTAQQVRDERKR